MQNLEHQSYDIPASLPEAQELVVKINSDIENLHREHQQQISWLKQQFKIAMLKARPEFVTESTLRDLFDESKVYTNPEESVEVEAENAGCSSRKEKKARAKKRKTIPDHLPREIVEHDIDDTAKSGLSPMGFDTRLELKYIRAKFQVIEHRCLKYGKKDGEGIVRKPSEPTLIPQSYVSPELLSNIAVAKFCDHIPLYRQEQIYGSRHGVFITRQVMADWMIRLGEALNPLIGIMYERILESQVVSADETPVKMLTKGGVRTSTLSYMWQLSRWGPKPLIIFEHDPTRKKEVADRLLGSYEGYVQIDGYGGYDILLGEQSPRKRVGCMAHVQRKFKDLIKSLEKEHRGGHSALKAIDLIQKLYKIEEVCRGFTSEAKLKYRLDEKADKFSRHYSNLSSKSAKQYKKARRTMNH